jgi:TM2 domain-containing membrane protein YozV
LGGKPWHRSRPDDVAAPGRSGENALDMTGDTQRQKGEVRLPHFADAADPLALIAADPSRQRRYDALRKSAAKAYLLWLLLGPFGGHRFYLGYYPSGIFLALLSGLGLVLALINPVGLFILVAPGLWLLVDAFIIPAIVRHQNAELIEQVLR